MFTVLNTGSTGSHVSEGKAQVMKPQVTVWVIVQDCVSHKWTQPSQTVPTRPHIINALCHELLNKSEKQKVAYTMYQTGNQHVGADNVGNHPVALLVHRVEEEHPPEGMQQDEAEGQEGCRQEWSYLTGNQYSASIWSSHNHHFNYFPALRCYPFPCCRHTGLLLSKCVHGDVCNSLSVLCVWRWNGQVYAVCMKVKKPSVCCVYESETGKRMLYVWKWKSQVYAVCMKVRQASVCCLDESETSKCMPCVWR